MDQLNAGKKVNPEEAILVNASEELILYSKFPEIVVTKDQLLSLPSTSCGTTMARGLLSLFFEKLDLGKVNRAMLEAQHKDLMEAIYGNFFLFQVGLT